MVVIYLLAVLIILGLVILVASQLIGPLTTIILTFILIAITVVVTVISRWK